MLIKSRTDAKSSSRRYIYAQNGHILAHEQAHWLHAQASPLPLVAWLKQPLFVAEWAGEDIYLQIIADHVATPFEQYHGRAMMALLSGSENDLLGRALQLSHWLRDHQYCGRCGQAAKLHNADYGMHCHACQHTQYPRLSPSIIVVVTGPEGILLAHNRRFPSGRFSALAGFVEAGESVEAAVHREVREEVGIAIKNLQYTGSQSWSFPHSLMLGFLAEYKSGEICVDQVEIDKAAWFTPDSLPDLPARFSIARQLVDMGLAKCHMA
ncbi:MAG: NAD(+) diphosphatase [Gammaproteobacteria bacterium]|jgi:NAD+ diphosphatase|nr:NAD(+) diphosphatase [Gammaproteobacteria bacterium]